MTNTILQTKALREIESAHANAEPPLMERAGSAAAAVAREMIGDSQLPVLVLAGPGNNGGDAFVVARLHRQSGRDVLLVFAGDPMRLPPDARRACDAWIATGGECLSDMPDGPWGLIVDGLFGVGLARPIEGRYADWIDRANASGCPILALDIPSGLGAETGCVTGPAIRATRTVTFIALKPGLLTGDGPDHCGELVACDLGLPIPAGDGRRIAPDLFRSCLQPRQHNSHKGSFGSVAILGGAPGMAGAALLAGRAALGLGAGRVYLGMLERLPVDLGQPELMLRGPDEALAAATVVAIGPGLGQTIQASELLMRTLESPRPLVLDADALNLLAEVTLLQRMLAVRPAPTFLTPHPAEAARLLGTRTEDIQSNRLSAARELARRFKAHVALKGCGTIVVAPDGRWFINATGNPGLATAGSGDVLTGMLAALLAQHWTPLEAQLGAVHLHGAAADACAANGHGPIGLTASELVAPARNILNGWTATP